MWTNTTARPDRLLPGSRSPTSRARFSAVSTILKGSSRWFAPRFAAVGEVILKVDLPSAWGSSGKSDLSTRATAVSEASRALRDRRPGFLGAPPANARSHLSILALRLEEGEQVRVDFVLSGRAHAMRCTLVDLWLRVLDQRGG